MTNDELLTDDFVAGLLAKEANDCSLKYSAMGMDAYRSDKKPTSMPKPNTRFLRNIIKSTDSHNKALLAKEAAESKARLGDLEGAVEDKRQDAASETKSIRRKQMGDIQAILGGKKRSGTSDDATKRRRQRDEGHLSLQHERRDRSSRAQRDLFDDKDESRRHTGRLFRHDKEDDERRSERTRRRNRRADDEGRRKSRSHRDRSRSPRRRSDSHNKERSRRHRSPAQHRSSPPSRRKEKLQPEEDDESDPLEDLIGPAPAPKYRGRGTVAGSSGIDRRFSESYDPKADVNMEEVVTGEANWDDAVEAFRDRQRMRQNQQERLRSAGFGDEQIQRLSGQAGAASEENSMKWTKAGEKREWDRGKGEGKEPTLLREFSDDEL